MGADFLLACAPMPHDAQNKTLDPESSEVRAELERRIDALAPEDLSAVGEWSGDNYEYGPPEQLLAEDPETYGVFAGNVRQRLKEAIDVLIGHSREIAIFELKLGEVQWIFSGGMSWGDSPTEAFDHIQVLGMSRITLDPIRGDLNG